MKQEIYHFLNNRLNNMHLAKIIANVLYFIISIGVLIKLILVKNKKKTLNDIINARKYISQISPKPSGCVEINSMKPCDEQVMLSIIIPVYNYENVIRECIESVINQVTQFKYEIILIDDGATDSSGEIMDEYSNSSYVRIIHKENTGISNTRNIGIEESIGEYITFVDCDDILDLNFVEKMMTKAFETKSDIVECGYHYFKETSETIISKRYVLPSEKLSGHSIKICKYPGLPWAKVYKRDLFRNVRFPDNYWFEDTILHFLLFPLAHSFLYIEDDLYSWRRNSENFTNKQVASPKTVEHYWVVEYLLEEADRIGIPKDEIYSLVLFRHLGPYLCNGTRRMDITVRENLFALACDLWKKKKSVMPKISLLEKQLLKALETNNFAIWDCVCKYI